MASPETLKRRQANRPRLRTLAPTGIERHASWLELFFDLVFVLAVSATARILTEHTDLIGFAKYVALFVPIWYAWIGFTFYADRFETEEASYRILMFAGMLSVIGLSLVLGRAFTVEGDLAFIVCFSAMLLVLITLYARAAYYVPLARAYCRQFIIGLSGSLLILLVSLAFDPPVRYILWALSLILELGIPFFSPRTTRLIPVDRSHLPERFGLFTIIVLGEAVIATATGAGAVQWTVTTIVTASLGFGMAACVWWINFDFVEDNALRSNSLFKRFVFLYGHFFIVASIVVMGVGAEHAIQTTGDAHLHFSALLLIAGGTAAYLTSITIVRILTGICNLVWIRIVAIMLVLSFIYFGQFVSPLTIVAAFFVVMLGNILIEGRYFDEEIKKGKEGKLEESAHLVPCEHADQIKVSHPRSDDGCEECRKNNYKWVHLRLCMTCGHVGCCDTSVHKHATKHFHQTEHPIIASLEAGEKWAWCYVDERFVPVDRGLRG